MPDYVMPLGNMVKRTERTTVAEKLVEISHFSSKSG